MASPFHVFRKHQKILIAVLGLLAMIAFCILGVVQQSMNSARKGKSENPVVVTTEKYGDLRKTELKRMQENRRYLLNVLQGAIHKAADKDRMFEDYFSRLVVAYFELNDFSEEATVNHWLVVQRARELNMVVSDATISKFLRDITDNRLSNDQFAQLYREFRVPEEFVFNALQEELLAANLVSMFRAGLNRSATPAERWDYYQRLKRRIDLEVVPIDVAGFVDDKSDPGDAELKKFFEKYKDRTARADLPDPGFRETPAVAIEYIKADIDKFADPAAVTDEEIKAYYTENRELYRNVQLPGLDLDEPAETPKSPDAEEAAPKAPEKPSGQEAALTDDKEAAKPDVPQEAAPKTDETPADKPDEKTSSKAAARSPFRFVSMNDEAKQDAPKPEPASGEDQKKPEAEKAEATPPAKAAIELPSLPAGDPGEAKTPSADTPQKETTPKAFEPAKPLPKYKPLKEVEEDIRRALARQKVRERILKGFQPIRRNMSKFHKNYIIYEASKDEEGNTDKTEPTIDLESMANPASDSFWVKKTWKLVDAEKAKEYQPDEIEPADRFGPLVKTGLVTPDELQPMDIANSITEGEQMFIEGACGTMPLRLPGISWDIDGNCYLFWKTDEKEERVPEFKEVRDKVLAAWRFNEARKAATERAEELAKQAREAGISLRDSIGKEPGIDVKRTGEFTWITGNTLTTRPSLRMSTVENVEMAGNKFMETAYGLNIGQVGVAMNQPQSTVYVMRLVKTNPLESVLMASFEIEDYSKYAAIGNYDVQKLVYDWLKTIREDAGLDWVRPPEPPEQRQR